MVPNSIRRIVTSHYIYFGKTSACILSTELHHTHKFEDQHSSTMGKAKKSKLNRQTSKPYTKLNAKSNSQPSCHKKSKAAKPPPPTIPFFSTDRILLVGEGDFSFSHSLFSTHDCSSLVATSYDKPAVVTSKYPQAASYIKALEAEEGCKILYGVDATKLGRRGTSDGGGKDVRRGGFDRVVFNFPHVGGLTKDVNRQVRYNQGTDHWPSLNGC